MSSSLASRPELIEAYRHCENITRRSGSSFTAAFWLLSAEKRRAMHALYAFCRFADDIADDPSLDGNRESILRRWREELAAVYSRKPTTQIGVALADSVRRYELPVEPFEELLAGIESDLRGERFETFADLKLYCYRVASTVGLLIVRILGCTDDIALRYAETLGIAVQLTNVLRDVGTDARSGRVYLPQCDLLNAGIDPQSMTDALGGEPLRLVMAAYAERARIYYERAEQLLPAGERPVLRAAEAMGSIYRNLLEELRRRSFPCEENPVRLSRRRRVAIAASAWFGQEAAASAAITAADEVLANLVAPYGTRAAERNASRSAAPGLAEGASNTAASDTAGSGRYTGADSGVDIGERKRSHIDLCVQGDVEARSGTLLDDVHMMHEALPDLALDELDTRVELFGRTLSAPILISGMTGGTREAGAINRAMAEVAGELGLGMGVGSQRAMLEDPATASTYRVRDVAPDIVLLANLGAVQARDVGPERVLELVSEIEADGLCVHLNAAQELVQDEGDRDFRGCLDAIAEIAALSPVPVIVKETGCGMAPRTLARIREAGLGWVDVAGAGGTTWTGVEALRGSRRQQMRGADLREWGIPTAAAVAYARRAGLEAIASGGIRTAEDIIAAIALGARAASLALPFLRAYSRDGVSGAIFAGQRLCEGVRARMLLTGAADIQSLRSVPRVIGNELRAWIEPYDSATRSASAEGPSLVAPIAARVAVPAGSQPARAHGGAKARKTGTSAGGA